jgi:ArsR family transcriptional regulator, arsenate/arsenite/antimonite-responsive transcriptional repressor
MTEMFAMSAYPLAVVGHVGPELSGDAMDEPHALAALAALGQGTRLAIFRLLVSKEPAGMSAGALAEAVGCPHNTLSTHVAILARAGLVYGTREGRTITYRADAAGTRALIGFLLKDCCEGKPELCGLLTEPAQTSCGCGPATPSRKRVTRRNAR